MILNKSPKNVCIAHDLTDEEIDYFYQGSGYASIEVDNNDNIVSCVYHDKHTDSELNNLLSAMKNRIDGMMSCCQFCPTGML